VIPHSNVQASSTLAWEVHHKNDKDALRGRSGTASSSHFGKTPVHGNWRWPAWSQSIGGNGSVICAQQREKRSLEATPALGGTYLMHGCFIEKTTLGNWPTGAFSSAMTSR
jgi:hypothetical protein